MIHLCFAEPFPYRPLKYLLVLPKIKPGPIIGLWSNFNLKEIALNSFVGFTQTNLQELNELNAISCAVKRDRTWKIFLFFFIYKIDKEQVKVKSMHSLA